MKKTSREELQIRFFKLFPDFSYTKFQLQISAQCHGEDNWSHQVFYEQMYGDEYRGGIYARVKVNVLIRLVPALGY